MARFRGDIAHLSVYGKLDFGGFISVFPSLLSFFSFALSFIFFIFSFLLTKSYFEKKMKKSVCLLFLSFFSFFFLLSFDRSFNPSLSFFSFLAFRSILFRA